MEKRWIILLSCWSKYNQNCQKHHLRTWSMQSLTRTTTDIMIILFLYLNKMQLNKKYIYSHQNIQWRELKRLITDQIHLSNKHNKVQVSPLSLVKMKIIMIEIDISKIYKNNSLMNKWNKRRCKNKLKNKLNSNLMSSYYIIHIKEVNFSWKKIIDYLKWKKHMINSILIRYVFGHI